MFGFKFKENFQFPYLSTSITEFWRRWHISLGTWFKDYIYIPLGGNRKGYIRTLVNIGIVFLVTGIWHGAGPGYFCWGLMHGFFVIAERCSRDRTWYKKTPKFLKWLLTMFIVNIGWTAFYIEDFSEMMKFFGVMFGTNKNSASDIYLSFRYFLTPKVAILMIVAILGSILPGLSFMDPVKKKINSEKFMPLKEMSFVILMIISIIVMYNSTYSPFIYFQY